MVRFAIRYLQPNPSFVVCLDFKVPWCWLSLVERCLGMAKVPGPNPAKAQGLINIVVRQVALFTDNFDEKS